MTQAGFAWDADVNLPVSGKTLAAREASATGAQSAAVVFGSRASKLLAAFAKFGRLTIAQASDVTAMKESSVCSVWAKVEKAGWIEGTGEFFVYQCHGRNVRREYHRLTVEGKRAAFAQLTAIVHLKEGR